MRIIFRRLAWLSVWTCAAAHAAVIPCPLPPVAGTVSGEAQLSPGSPALDWRIAAKASAAGEQSLEISVHGEGLSLQARAHIITATRSGEWRLQECRLDLAPWSAALAERFPAFSGWQMQGTLAIDGHGTVRDGVIDGAVTLALLKGKLSNPEKKIACDGITGCIVLASLQSVLSKVEGASLRTETPQELTINTIKTGSAELHDTKISFELLPDGQIRVAAAGANGFGGKFSVQPFSFAPASGAIDFTVQATNLELGQIRIVLDAQQQRIREAAGRVSGKVALHFDKEGLRIGQGALTMRKGELARILFQPTPGLFTSYVPATIRPYYRGFEPIELGKLSLVMSAFQIKFYPDGEQADRSMLIQLQGNSSDARFPAPIDEDINVNGPLQQAIHSFLSLSRKH